MTQHEQDEFARRFGDLEFAATPLTNIERDGTLRSIEHALQVPARQRAMAPRQHLHAGPGEGRCVHRGDRVPDEGGDTGFADMRVLPDDALDDATRERIDSLAAHHSRRYSMDRADLHVKTRRTPTGTSSTATASTSSRRYARWSRIPTGHRSAQPLDRTARPRDTRAHRRRVRGTARPAQRRGLPRLRAPTTTRGRREMRCCGTTGVSCTGRPPTIPDRPDGCGTPGSPETRRPKPVSTTDHWPTRRECQGSSPQNAGGARRLTATSR